MNRTEIKLSLRPHGAEMQSIKIHGPPNSIWLCKLLQPKMKTPFLNWLFLLLLTIRKIPLDTPQSTQNKNSIPLCEAKWSYTIGVDIVIAPWCFLVPPPNLSPTLESQSNVGFSHKWHCFLSVVIATASNNIWKSYTSYSLFISLTTVDWAKRLLVFVTFHNVNSSNIVRQSWTIFQLVMEFLRQVRNSRKKPCIAEPHLEARLTTSEVKHQYSYAMLVCICNNNISFRCSVSIPSTYN